MSADILVDRFAAKVEFDHSSGCWVWQAATAQGYGRFSENGTAHLAHRWIYKRVVGAIPRGLELDHICRNTLCVNPDHLEPVTRAENMRRRYVDYTHCRHGHEFTPENTYTKANGCRLCKACNRDRTRARRAAKA